MRLQRNAFYFLSGERVDWQCPNSKHTSQMTYIKINGHLFPNGTMRIAQGMFDNNFGKRFVATKYFVESPIKIENEVIVCDVPDEYDLVLSCPLCVEISNGRRRNSWNCTKSMG